MVERCLRVKLDKIFVGFFYCSDGKVNNGLGDGSIVGYCWVMFLKKISGSN